MNSCLRRNGTLAEQDRAREEWFATRVQNKREATVAEEERVRKVYAERKRIDEIQARTKVEGGSTSQGGSWLSFWSTDPSSKENKSSKDEG